MKKKILVLNGQYLPGYKGGGPIQSCANMVENLADQFEFLVITSDRDYKAENAYENIKVNEWTEVGSAKVFYMSPDRQTLSSFRKILNETEFDMLYLNGFFSPIFTIKPLFLRMLGKLKKKAIILTPRGDFTGGCENKKFKKYTYIFLCKMIGLYSDLVWHATSALEEEDIKKKFRAAKTFVVPNLPAKYVSKAVTLNKRPGELRLVFVSRIFPKKNLKFALEVLQKVNKGNIIFDIYGPMEDKDYWKECQAIIKEMPHNIKVRYKEEVKHSEVAKVFSKYHGFFFPTLGENYGHVIVESMMNNCLVILSKGVTPWDSYGEEVGTLANLEDQNEFVKVIKRLLDMDDLSFRSCIEKNNEFVNKVLNASSTIDSYVYYINKIG
ncbi:glycosyltransferase family 4 protein [Priestia megaterium]|uniref:glycosyltransferase family 4 protein n=1 Tax=Priestia megaterium TaxID=1404 RepID=UPI003D01C967